MKVLITGTRGFIGKNLCESLKNIRDGKDRRVEFSGLNPLEIFEVGRDTSENELARYCRDCDYVVHLAGVNRPQRDDEFEAGNFGFTSKLIEMLKAQGNNCPVLFASSIQASCEGRYADISYGKSKRMAEEILRQYSRESGADVLIYRFPNVYGKWCNPNYNSVIATFCYNLARNLPIRVDNPDAVLSLLYIDDLVDEILRALVGRQNCSGDFCVALPVDTVSLGEIVELLQRFQAYGPDKAIPVIPENSFRKKLLSTYLSYAPADSLDYRLVENSDERGAFVEFIRTESCGQVSINITRPGVVRGNHWHHTKWELFCVVSGVARICVRQIGVAPDGASFPTVEYLVKGDERRVIKIPPGYTHSIENLSAEDDLITLMWANELFDECSPDTYFEVV